MKDLRNVADHYKEWTVDLIKEDLSLKFFPYAVCMAQIIGDFNFGSVVRSANAFAAKEVFYYGKKHYDRRGAVGVQNYTDVKFLSSIEELKLLKNKYTFVGLENNITKLTNDIKFFVWPKNSLLIIGEEAVGISEEILDLCDYLVEIPIVGSVRSLNAASAATLAMYDYMVKF